MSLEPGNSFAQRILHTASQRGWNTRPLKYLFKRQKVLGAGDELLLSIYRDYGVVAKESRDDNFNKSSDDLSKYQVVHSGDLVVNKMKAWQGSVAVSELDGIISPAYFVYKPSGEIYQKYAHYLLRSGLYFQYYASISTGVRPNQWDLDPMQFDRMPVPTPPPIEQRQIADYLDHETAEIDAFIADQQEVRVLLQERWESLLVNHIQTGMKDPRNLEETGIQEWPRAPRSWRKARLKTTMTDIKNGSWGDELDAGEVNRRCIRVADFEKNSAVIHDRNATKRSYPASTVKNLALRPGDLLIEKSGGGPTTPVGNVVSYNGLEQAMYSNFVARMRLNTSMDSRYTTYLHRSLYLNQVTHRSIKQTTGIQNLDASAYFNETVFLPPRNEQVELGAQVEESRLETESALDTTAQAIELSRERRAALITAAVTGQIDVTAKNKPAAEQLEDDIAQGLHKES